MVNDNYTPQTSDAKLGAIIIANKRATLKLKIVQQKLNDILRNCENRRARNGFYDISFTDNSYMYSKTNQVVKLLENNLEFICDINDAVDESRELEKDDFIKIYKKTNKNPKIEIKQDKCVLVESKHKPTMKPILMNMKKIVQLIDKLIAACRYANNVKINDDIKWDKFDMEYEKSLRDLMNNNNTYIEAIEGLVTLSTTIEKKEVKDGS